mmetsp:Transcript_28426/g.27387  ORF Transcript_28426/g.27387 Transcript_28426/m.27387 type:complete len:245 (+) Transcript_28426:1136-1870(+)
MMRVFKDFQIISEEQAFTVISHKNYLSCFDMSTDTWAKHIRFPSSEIKWFIEIIEHEDSMYIFIILDNGDVYLFDTTEIEQLGDKLYDIEQGDEHWYMQLEGDLTHIFRDRQSKKVALIMTTDGDKGHLYLVIAKEIIDITDRLIEGVDASSNFIIMQGGDLGKLHFAHQKEQEIFIHMITNKKKVDGEAEIEGEKEDIASMLEIQFKSSIKNYHRKVKHSTPEKDLKVGLLHTFVQYNNLVTK